MIRKLFHAFVIEGEKNCFLSRIEICLNVLIEKNGDIPNLSGTSQIPIEGEKSSIKAFTESAMKFIEQNWADAKIEKRQFVVQFIIREIIFFALIHHECVSLCLFYSPSSSGVEETEQTLLS